MKDQLIQDEHIAMNLANDNINLKKYVQKLKHSKAKDLRSYMKKQLKQFEK